MDGLITSYFPAKARPKKKTKKRTSSTLDGVAETKTKRKKLAKESSGSGSEGVKASGSKSEKGSRGSTRQPSTHDIRLSGRKVDYISSDDEDLVSTSAQDHQLPLPRFSPLPSSSPPPPSSSFLRDRAPREDSIIPPTPDHERVLPASSVSSPVTLVRLRGLTQTWSDETVASSQSQEEDDGEYGGPSYSHAFDFANRASFTTPRKSQRQPRVVDDYGDSENEIMGLLTPKTVQSSQTQHLSLPRSSARSFGKRASSLVDDSLELIPSSQSQEKELDMTMLLSQRMGWYSSSQM